MAFHEASEGELMTMSNVRSDCECWPETRDCINEFGEVRISRYRDIYGSVVVYTERKDVKNE